MSWIMKPSSEKNLNKYKSREQNQIRRSRHTQSGEIVLLLKIENDEEKCVNYHKQPDSK